MDILRLAEANAAVTGGVAGAALGFRANIFGKKGVKGGGPKLSTKKKVTAGIFVILVLVILAIIVTIINLPNLVIATLDYNLQRAVGIDHQSAVLEEQAMYISEEMIMKGQVPDGYGDDLAACGIEVGQVNLAGDFVRTNSYIANLDGEEEVASVGGARGDANKRNSELAVRFKDRIIEAGDFVATLESDPEMYAAYSEAVRGKIDTYFVYSKRVDDVYKEMGLSRNSFGGWVSTGDSKKDQENFDKILAEMLDKKSSVTVNGYNGDDNSEFSTSVVGQEASGVVNAVASNTRGANATEKAAQLLNAAVSAEEPYRAAAVFMAIEEPIQRARIDGTGPVNELMNDITQPTAVTYRDVETGELVTEEKSLLETTNFVAAVSGGDYSRKEAANFSRDRVLEATNTSSSEVIKGTTIATKDYSVANIVLGISGGESADAETLSKVDSSVAIALEENNSELFSSVVGGNRALEGGMFIVNTINAEELGAVPADAEEVGNYYREANKVFARRAKADRATLSPFDISSPYTFMGSLIHNFATMMIKNFSSSSSSSPLVSVVGTISDLTSDSIGGLFGGAMADGEVDNDLATMLGYSCTTVKTANNAEGNLYCDAHKPLSTKYMDKTDWEGAIDENELKQFIALGLDREATVGVKSSDVCERWKDFNNSGLEKALNALSSALGLYQSCSGVDDDASTGARYTASASNAHKAEVELYSAYVRYDTTYSILSDMQSNVARIRDEYYSKYPKKNSAAARIARISGMSEAEAEIALEYSAYLSMIANYRPDTRFKFRKNVEGWGVKESEMFQEKVLEEGMYLAWCEKRELADVRNRNFVV